MKCTRLLTENLQRVGFLSHLPELLRRFGVDPLKVLAAAGLSPHALDKPEGTIPYRAMGLLAEASCERTGCPHFGLDIGREIRTSTLGILGELMRNSPTLRVALQDFALHQHRHAHGGVVYLMEDQLQAFFGYAVYQPNVPGNSMICDGAAMGAFTVFCELAGGRSTSGCGSANLPIGTAECCPLSTFFRCEALFQCRSNRYRLSSQNAGAAYSGRQRSSSTHA